MFSQCLWLMVFLVACFSRPGHGAVEPSCDPSFNSGFGLGTRPLTPANNTPTAPPTGPYPVGVRFESFCFQGRHLTLSYWYPAAVSNTSSTPFMSTGGILGHAVENATVDTLGKPYPAIIFSPGLAAVNDAYYFYTQNLASHGYVVVSIQHFDARFANVTRNPTLLLRGLGYANAGNTNDAVITLYTDWMRETAFGFTYRPQEISFAINQTVSAASNSSSPFFGAIDPDKIGMSGHSMGGFYTQVVGGGMPIYCDYPMTPKEMDTTGLVMAEVNPCAFSAVRNLTSPTALHDPRIKAILTLAAPTFLNRAQVARSGGGIAVPMMILTGDNSTSETPVGIQRDVFRAATGPSVWVKIRGVNHYLVSDAYGLNPTMAGNASPGDKENFADKAGVYMVYSAAFFDAFLKGNESARGTLGVARSPFVAELEVRNSGNVNGTVGGTSGGNSSGACRVGGYSTFLVICSLLVLGFM